MPTLSSLVALQVVVTTTCRATNDDKVGKWQLPLQAKMKISSKWHFHFSATQYRRPFILWNLTRYGHYQELAGCYWSTQIKFCLTECRLFCFSLSVMFPLCRLYFWCTSENLDSGQRSLTLKNSSIAVHYLQEIWITLGKYYLCDGQ